MANKNENLQAAWRDKPRNRPAVIVMPDREVPGTSASTCARPINNAIGKVTACSSAIFFRRRSASHNSTPNAAVAPAITSGERSCDSTMSSRKNPVNTTGKVATRIAQANRASVLSCLRPAKDRSHAEMIAMTSPRKNQNTAINVPR
jgi:hypothetical protein